MFRLRQLVDHHRGTVTLTGVATNGTGFGYMVGLASGGHPVILGCNSNCYATLTNWNRGQGSFTIGGQKTAQPGKKSITSAAGGLISAGTGPTSDDVPAWVSRGEYVVKAAAVAKYGTHMMNMLNAGRLASGGLVETGNLGVLNGQYAVDSYNQFSSAMTAAMVAAMRAAIATAAAAAAKAAKSSGGGVAGPGGGAPAANAALARRMFPQYATGANWAAWNFVEMREAGWNQFARNPSSGAYGIPQALPPSKMGAAANPPMSNPAAQISWMVSYMNSVYGGPQGAANHESNFGWYGGGLNAIFRKATLIGVGERGPERVSVTPAASGDPALKETNALLRQVVAHLAANPDRTGAAVTDGLNGAARSAYYSGRYSAR